MIPVGYDILEQLRCASVIRNTSARCSNTNSKQFQNPKVVAPTSRRCERKQFVHSTGETPVPPGISATMPFAWTVTFFTGSRKTRKAAEGDILIELIMKNDRRGDTGIMEMRGIKNRVDACNTHHCFISLSLLISWSPFLIVWKHVFHCYAHQACNRGSFSGPSSYRFYRRFWISGFLRDLLFVMMSGTFQRSEVLQICNISAKWQRCRNSWWHRRLACAVNKVFT